MSATMLDIITIVLLAFIAIAISTLVVANKIFDAKLLRHMEDETRLLNELKEAWKDGAQLGLESMRVEIKTMGNQVESVGAQGSQILRELAQMRADHDDRIARIERHLAIPRR